VWGIPAHGIPDEPILNDDEESESTQPKAGEGYHEVGSTGELDAALRDPTRSS
jgi:hypothetical protein